MDEDKRKTVMIIVAISCICLAAFITYWMNFRGGDPRLSPDRPVYFKCLNKKCGYVKETTAKNMNEEMDQYLQPSMMDLGPTRYQCPECNKRSMFVADKCSKCDTVFVQRTSEEYPDRCPKCKYSALEEEEKQN